MISSGLPSGGSSRSVVSRQYWASKILARSPRIRRKLANIGEVADHLTWLGTRFGDVEVLRSREELWEILAARVTPPVHGLEFGVAWGYASDWWLKRLAGPQVRWDGFDRFTGLPRDWRDLRVGHFDAGGRPPAIDDDRVTWHVGDVEDRIDDVTLGSDLSEQLVALFDLDVFEPSLVAWQRLRDHLRPGDLLYFDEALDRDERHLLEHHILPAGKFGFVGATPQALAVVVESISGTP